MRILHIGKYFPPHFGGIETFMAELVKCQCQSGHQVLSVVHDRNESSRSNSDQYGTIERVHAPLVIAFAPIAPTFRSTLQKQIKAFVPDVIHIHMPNPSAFWLLTIKLPHNTKLIVHWHSDVLGEQATWLVRLLYPVYALFERRLLKKADAVIATSPPYLASSVPLQSVVEKCHAIPLGISQNQSKTVVSTAGDAIFRCLMVGRLTYYKGHSVMLRAIQLLVGNGIKNIHLDCVGVGELLPALERLIEQLNIAEYVTFHGQLSDSELNQQLANCDLVCLPSLERTEAFGMVLLEAMHMSKACLVSDVEGSGMSWVVADGETGCVVKAGDAKHLADKLHWAMEHPEVLAQWGQRGRQRLEQQFSIEAVAADVERLYVHQ